MTPPVSQGIPTNATAGDTWRWRVDRAVATSSYPAVDGWTLSLQLRGPTVTTPVDVARTDDGDVAVVPVATTAGFVAGRYVATVFAARGEGDARERYTVGVATVIVAANPATAGQLLSHSEKAVAMLEARIEGRIPTDAEAYTTVGQSLTRTPLETLVKMLNRYRAKVALERNGGRLPDVVVRRGF